VHVRIGLGTLLGLDEQAGEIAGWGIVPADTARKLVERQHDAEWRYAILDAHGRLLFDGITGHRPPPSGTDRTGTRRRRRRTRRRTVAAGIVELHVPLALLSDPGLAAAHPGWARLLTDLAGQYARREPIEQDPGARFPGRRLRRRTQTVFQRCVFRGCRRPATDCDTDHRREHHRGGPTQEDNLQPGCDHDHALKTTGGWQLHRHNPHSYLWISPLGRHHLVPIDPIAPPLPAPVAERPLADRDPPEADWSDNDPPETDPPEQPTAAPSCRPLDRRGRPLPTATTTTRLTRLVESTADPPPF
jgi:hypothetical protein